MQIDIRRSAQRRKTVAARLQGDTLIVYLPTGLSPQEEQRWVERMMEKATKAKRRSELNNDGELARRAQELNARYFDGRLTYESIKYVTNQNDRFGSCTPATGTIRISHRLAEMPSWVLDYVIVHELAHLLQPNHSDRFWRLVNRYKLAERARGFLMAKGMEDDETPEKAAE